MNRQAIKRELAKLSYGELARKAGVGKPHVSLVFRGLRNASQDTVNKLAKSLGCTPSDLASFLKRPVDCRPYGRRPKSSTDVRVAA
jgi:transcriptional regulator with XRE-family HTH domain